MSVSQDLVATGRIATQKPMREDLVEDLTVTGEVSSPPDGAAQVGAPVSGRLRDIAAREGDRVAKGSVLAVVEAADVSRTHAELGRARARRERAARILAQEERLSRENATSDRSLSEARSELAAAEAEERGAATLLETFGATGAGRITLRSPIAGTVVEGAVVLGKPVEAGAVLFRIVDAARLLVRADVPESDAGDVALGSVATIVWPAQGARCSGSVESRAPSVDPTTRTIPYRVLPAPGCPELVEGGFVDVVLSRRSTSQTNLVAVPRDAVVEVEGVPVVFVAGNRPGEFTMRTIRVARLASAKAYVEDGIATDDAVVVKGAILLKGELMRAALE